MNRIVIVGNGFDLAHSLPTKYVDFINHIKNQYIFSINKNVSDCKISDHIFFALYPESGSEKKANEVDQKIINVHKKELKSWDDIEKTITVEYRAISEFGVPHTRHYKPRIKFKNSLLLSSFQNSVNMTWGGIENDYKDALTKIIKDYPGAKGLGHAEKLNLDMKDIMDELVAYLSGLPIPPSFKKEIAQSLYTEPLTNWGGHISDEKRLGGFRTESIVKEQPTLEKVLFLNFNYTSTVNNYLINESNEGKSLASHIKNKWISNDIQTVVRYIHGDLCAKESNPIIFGYGDEQDEHQLVLERMNNEYFKHIKSVQYTRTPYYREMIDFADAQKFDIIIYGHSCSNTDRTLLNTLFEHQNCVSIQPYLYDRKDSSIYNNIYRCFKDKKLMRSRVVDQTNTVGNRER